MAQAWPEQRAGIRKGKTPRSATRKKNKEKRCPGCLLAPPCRIATPPPPPPRKAAPDPAAPRHAIDTPTSPSRTIGTTRIGQTPRGRSHTGCATGMSCWAGRLAIGQRPRRGPGGSRNVTAGSAKTRQELRRVPSFGLASDQFLNVSSLRPVWKRPHAIVVIAAGPWPSRAYAHAARRERGSVSFRRAAKKCRAATVVRLFLSSCPLPQQAGQVARPGRITCTSGLRRARITSRGSGGCCSCPILRIPHPHAQVGVGVGVGAMSPV